MVMTHVYDLASIVVPSAKRSVTHAWYRVLTDLAAKLSVDADLLFLNYGSADLDPSSPRLILDAEDESNRYGIQLYHQTVAAVDPEGQEVLEVGCGRGGGASYIHRYLKPKTLVGLDQCEQAVAFCRAHYCADGLSFVAGDAESLPFVRDHFDAVVNVESSHCYPYMERFLSEVHRVLRPGGSFLFSDNRLQTTVPTLRQQLARSGLAVVAEQDITQNVLHALDLDSVRLCSLIEEKAPWPLTELLRQFAALPGTTTYEEFCSGKRVYLRYALRKMCE
jgi:ubiquinone/menaquinone biosynthesis C-methylase UbiE